MRTAHYISLSLCLGLVLGGLAVWAFAPRRQTPEPAPADLPSGMELVEAYQCHPAETKTVIVRGVEDGFSPVGEELAEAHSRLRGLAGYAPSRRMGRQYDEGGQDKVLIDHFILPPDVTAAQFAFSYRVDGTGETSGLTLGDLSPKPEPVRNFRHSNAALEMDTLNEATRINSDGLFWQGDFRDIKFQHFKVGPEPSHDNLLQFVQDSPMSRPVDFVIGEDIAVDFVAISYCESPRHNRGMTFEVSEGVATSSEYVLLECNSHESKNTCDVFEGDTECSEALPVACFHETGELPAEDADTEVFTLREWSGGELATTSPVAATNLRSVDDAHSFCAEQFGPEWRVASFHDGGRGFRLLGRKFGKVASGRVWLDIKDQPYATCWTR